MLNQTEVVGLWLIGVGGFVAMLGLMLQPPTGLNGTPMGVATRRARLGYSVSTSGAFASAIGALVVAAENIPSWAWWIAVSIAVVGLLGWLVNAHQLRRDARKLALSQEATWYYALRHPFTRLENRP